MQPLMENVDEALHVHYSRLSQVIGHSTQDCKTKCLLSRPVFGPKTMANAISDYVRHGLAIFAEETNGFCTCEDRGGFFISAHHKKLALRPKKIDRNHRSKNILTKRVEAMKAQNYSLPGFEDDTVFLTLGYLLDENTYDLIGVYIVNEGPVVNHWEIKIDSLLNVEQKELIMPSAQVEVGKRVKRKQEKENEIAV